MFTSKIILDYFAVPQKCYEGLLEALKRFRILTHAGGPNMKS